MFIIHVIRNNSFILLSTTLALLVILPQFLSFTFISGIWIYVFLLTIFAVSIWLTCVVIHFLLVSNSPLKYETLASLSKNAVFNHFLGRIWYGKQIEMLLSHEEKKDVCTEYDIVTLNVISASIEKKFVSSWFSDTVSKDLSFPLSCKELLDHIIAKSFQISKFIDPVDLTSKFMNIFLRHYKEYHRSHKRMEKVGKGKQEDYYKYSHPTSLFNNLAQKHCAPEDYCMILIRTFLKELLPWELWVTPHSFLLSSIIAKKLNSEICSTFSDPKWLKKFLSSITEGIPKQPDDTNSNNAEIPFSNAEYSVQAPAKEEPKVVVNVSARKAVETPAVQTIFSQKLQNIQSHIENKQIKSDTSHSPNKTSLETALTTVISHSTAPVLQRAEINTSSIFGETNDIMKSSGGPKYSRPIDIQDTNKIMKNVQEVKIYNRIDGHVKTWNSDIDLECVSLGQDLLESLDGEMDLESRLGRLWESDNVENPEGWSPNPLPTSTSNRLSNTLWFGEEDIDMELSEGSPPRAKVGNVKPSDPLSNFSIANIHNMKDLQNISKTTVNQAKHKIGDLQDEAAGVMEGILDFGLAGIKKGLRMTGLQDAVQENPKIMILKDKQTQQKLTIDGNSLRTTKNNSQPDLTVLNSPGGKWPADNLQKVSNQHLVKQHRVTSQDSAALEPEFKTDRSQSCTNESIELNSLQPKQTSMSNIPIMLPILDADSPEFEYEDTEDFATTIAKLRSLLQQKSSDVTPNPTEDSLQDTTLTVDTMTPFPGPGTLSFSQNNSPAHRSREHVAKLETIPMAVEAETNIFSDDQDDVPIHRAHIAWTGQNVPQIGNNMQRLDRLFTRTVTGVFNSIKTVVGADTQEGGGANLPLGVVNYDSYNHRLDHFPVYPFHNTSAAGLKHDWVFIDGDMDISLLVSRLLADRRGFCVVEAAQDSLEALTAPTNHSTTPPLAPHTNGDDLDESDIFTDCPLWQGLLEIYAIAVDGRHVPFKCASVLLANKVEFILRACIFKCTLWLKENILDYFRHLSGTSAPGKRGCKKADISQSSCCESEDYSMERVAGLIMDKIPDFIVFVLGEQNVSDALKSLLLSVDSSKINRDIAFQLLDLATAHFLKASSLRQRGHMPTPPPSA